MNHGPLQEAAAQIRLSTAFNCRSIHQAEQVSVLLVSNAGMVGTQKDLVRRDQTRTIGDYNRHRQILWLMVQTYQKLETCLVMSSPF